LVISAIACTIPPAIAAAALVWRYSPTQARKRLIGEARQMVADISHVRPTWRAEDHPDVYRVVHLDQMECVACMGSGVERFRVACRLCDGRGFLDAHHRDLTMAERRR
jgi:hypothetical protein